MRKGTTMTVEELLTRAHEQGESVELHKMSEKTSPVDISHKDEMTEGFSKKITSQTVGRLWRARIGRRRRWQFAFDPAQALEEALRVAGVIK
jgi:hypothetical protein